MFHNFLKNLKVKHEKFELEVISQSYYTREIKKPYCEFDYFFFDAILKEYDDDGFEIGKKYIEIEYDGKHQERLFGLVNINEIIISPNSTRPFIQNIVTDYLLDYENLQSRFKLDKLVAEKLGIINKSFSISVLLNKIYEKIESYYIEEINKCTGGKFLYEPFFFKGGESILVSKMGEGKTLWVLSMLYRLQNGIPLLLYENEVMPIILDNYVETCNVCYFAFEGNIDEVEEKKNEIKNYIKKEAELAGISEIKDFPIRFFVGDIVKRSNRKQIRKIISAFNPKFIVIDSVTSAFLSFSAVDRNHLIYSFIKETFINKGIGVMLLMHPSKQDIRDELNIPRGSIHHLAIPRVVWGLQQVSELKNGFSILIKSVKDNMGLKRFSYEYQVVFRVDENDNNVCEIKLRKVEDESVKKKKIKDMILQYFEEKGKKEITAKELATYFEINEDVVRVTLNRMVNSGILIKTGRSYMIKKKEDEIKDDNIPF